MYTTISVPATSTREPFPPFLIQGVTFICCVGVHNIPRGSLVTWFAHISPIYAAEIAANVDGKIMAAFAAHHIIDCEAITPITGEPLSASHVLTIRRYHD